MGWGGSTLRRSAVVVVAAIAVALPAGAGDAATGADCVVSAQTVSCDYGYTADEQTFTVPPGVHELQISAVGAAGGGLVGGAGAAASAAVAVAPGSTLYVEVGGAGSSGSGAAGGFNGGGAEGGGQNTGGAGSGGGASDVRTVSCGGSCPGGAASLASRLIVAGGGGGSGAAGPHSALGHGGAADADGTAGEADSAGDTGGGAGLAGSSAGGGALGAGGTAVSGGTDGDPGTDGGAGQGGGGGSGASPANAAGGGGGGGYFGGGGGGGGAVSAGQQAAGGGGGGGASYAPGGTGGTTSAAASVQIAYSIPAITITSPQQGAQYLAGTPATAAYSCAEAAPGAGVASCAGTVASGGALPFAPGQHTFTVTATDAAGNTASKSVSYSVIGPPGVRITSPANGVTVQTGQVVHTSFSCGEASGGPGITLCQDPTGTTPDPAPATDKAGSGLLDTTTLGAHAYTVTAVSADGLTATATLNYEVVGPPTLSGLTVTPKPAVAGRHTEFSFVLDEPATVRLGVAALLPGTLSAGVCTPLPVAQARHGIDLSPLAAVNLRLGAATQLFLPATAPPLQTPADYRPPRWFQTPRYGLPTPPECRTPGRWALIGQAALGAGKRTVVWSPGVARRPLPAGPYEVTAQAVTSTAASRVATAVLTLDAPSPPRITSLIAAIAPHRPRGSSPTTITQQELQTSFSGPGPRRRFKELLAWDDSQQATAVVYVVKQLPGRLVRRDGHELCLPAFDRRLYGPVAGTLQTIWNAHHGSLPFAKVVALGTPTEPPVDAQGNVIRHSWDCAILTTRNPILTHLDVPPASRRKTAGPSLTNCSLAGLCAPPTTLEPPANAVVWNGTADGGQAGPGIYDFRVEATNAAGQSSGTDVQAIVGGTSRLCGPNLTAKKGSPCAALAGVWDRTSGRQLTSTLNLPPD